MIQIAKKSKLRKSNQLMTRSIERNQGRSEIENYQLVMSLIQMIEMKVRCSNHLRKTLSKSKMNRLNSKVRGIILLFNFELFY